MAGTIGIGYQDFEQLQTNGIFYVDKTDFIREWWESCRERIRSYGFAFEGKKVLIG